MHHCLTKVFEVWCQSRPKTGLRGRFLHHEDASAHTAATTVAFLNESEVQLLPHPPYSPDLSPCDFFLFPEVKRRLKGTLFESAEDARRAFTSAFEDLPKSIWAEGDVVAQLVERRPRRYNGLHDQRFQSRPEHKKKW